MVVAICDDETSAIARIEDELKKTAEKLQIGMDIYKYQTGCELLEGLEKQKVETVFLDIDMPQMSGIEVANCLAERYPLLNVIFLTNRTDMVFDAVRCRPLRFVRKSLIGDELGEAVEAALKKTAGEMYAVSLGRGKAQEKFAIKDILYIESNKHYIKIHLQGETRQFRGRLSDCEKGLGDYGFIRVHKGYLVNIRYIASFRPDAVILDNAEKLPVSRDRAEKAGMQFTEGVERFVNAFYI